MTGPFEGRPHRVPTQVDLDQASQLATILQIFQELTDLRGIVEELWAAMVAIAESDPS